MSIEKMLLTQKNRGQRKESPYVVTHYMSRHGIDDVEKLAKAIWGKEIIIGFPGQRTMKGFIRLGWVSAHWIGPSIAIFTQR